MVEVTIRYEGDLRCTATHGPSTTTLQTDAPVDNMGKGESFSPTDLVATGLGTCILTILGIVSQRHGIPIGGAAVTVTKVMSAQPPRRIARLGVTVKIPQNLADEQKQRLVNAAEACPVKKSLHPAIEVPMHWVWG